MERTSSWLLVLGGLVSCAAGLPQWAERPCGDPVEPPADTEEPATADASPQAPEPDTSDEPAPSAPPVPQGLDADALLALTPDECYAQLDSWQVPYERVTGAPAEIEAPVRLTGPVAGVTYVIP